jgi:hypothetical protein
VRSLAEGKDAFMACERGTGFALAYKRPRPTFCLRPWIPTGPARSVGFCTIWRGWSLPAWAFRCSQQTFVRSLQGRSVAKGIVCPGHVWGM